VDPLILLAMALGLLMAYSIGANDVANAMGTSVGSRALTVRRAILIAAVLEFGGAFFAGAEVTKTIRGGILDVGIAAAQPNDVLYGMLAALTAAGLWLIVASRLGWPVSTTHSIVGAIAGFGCVALGTSAVEWGKLGTIVASWVVSPLLSGTMAFGVMNVIQRTLLDRDDPVAQTRRYAWAYVWVVVVVVFLVVLLKGLKNFDLELSFLQALLGAAVLATAVSLLATRWLVRLSHGPTNHPDSRFAGVERMFVVLQIVSACAVAFAHGSNDVANAIGPLAAAVDILQKGVMSASAPVPSWMLFIGAIGIVIGLATLGPRVMATVGERVTELTPTRGYAAEFSAALTIVVASQLGLPVSTTHTLIGAVLGVGLARGIAALDFRVVGQIVASWVITIPVGAGLSIFFYYFYKGLLLSLGASLGASG